MELSIGERVEGIRNLCEVAMLLINTGNSHLLPTVLEVIFRDAQELVDDTCVEVTNPS